MSNKEIMESLAEACSLNNLPSYLRSTYCPWCKCAEGLGLDGYKIMTDKLQRHITDELSKEDKDG